jgi:hypothetical protein
MKQNDATEIENEETVVEVELETVVKQAMDEFDYVASVTIVHLATINRLKTIDVRVYTGESEGVRDYLGLFSGDHRITIDRGDETLVIPFGVYAFYDGPVTWDSIEQTTIYMDQNVLGAKPVQLEDGLAYMRDKIKNPEEWNKDGDHAVSLERIRNYTD